MQRLLCFIWLLPLVFFPTFAFGAIGDSPSSIDKLYGVAQEGQPNMINAGGLHRHYQTAVLNTIIKIEAVFLKRKCVGIRYEAVPQIPGETIPLKPTIANYFLDENFGIKNWLWDNTKTNALNRVICKEFIHRRFHHTASYDGKSLTVWAKDGLLQASQAPLE